MIPISRPVIIHVSGDFPDPLVAEKTSAIKRLVDLTAEEFDHRVFSLNRRPSAIQAWVKGMGKPRLRTEESSFGYGEAISYQAPSRGLWHYAMLDDLGVRLAARVLKRGVMPQAVVGHKLTIEGVVVRRMASILGVPYLLSIQGNTDLKILRARADLRRQFAQIWEGAAVVFPFAPWAWDAVEEKLGPRTGLTTLLPCATSADNIIEPHLAGSGFVSAFHLRHWKTKGFDRLVAAQRLSDCHNAPSWQLAVIGDGTSVERARCLEIAGSGGSIQFEGHLPIDKMGQRLNAATAFVMPSRRESFGMVFIEALFAGTPIIYPRGQAIDGYFPGAPFAMAVDASSYRDIAAAMKHAVQNEIEIKRELARWQSSCGPTQFTRRAIGETFAAGLREAVRRSAVSSVKPIGLSEMR